MTERMLPIIFHSLSLLVFFDLRYKPANDVKLKSLNAWMDSRKVTRARNKVKGTGKWQINYLTLFLLFLSTNGVVRKVKTEHGKNVNWYLIYHALQELEKEGRIEKVESENGSLWKRNKRKPSRDGLTS